MAKKKAAQEAKAGQEAREQGKVAMEQKEEQKAGMPQGLKLEKLDWDKVIATTGLLASIAGIGVTLIFYLMVAGLLDMMHSSTVEQVDSVILALNDAQALTASAAVSVNSYSSFVSNASESVDYTADALYGMSGAVDSLAAGLASIPYMPSEAVSPLYGTSSEIRTTAASLSSTADSMEGSSDDILATSIGLTSLNQNIEAVKIDMQETKRNLDRMRSTAGLGLLLGALMMVLLFAVNGISFFEQLRQRK